MWFWIVDMCIKESVIIISTCYCSLWLYISTSILDMILLYQCIGLFSLWTHFFIVRNIELGTTQKCLILIVVDLWYNCERVIASIRTCYIYNVKRASFHSIYMNLLLASTHFITIYIYFYLLKAWLCYYYYFNTQL